MRPWNLLRKPRHLLLAILALSLALLLPLTPLPIHPSTARLSARVEAHPLPTVALPPPSPQADADARTAYQAGRFREAVTLFEQAIAYYSAQTDAAQTDAAQTDALRQAMAEGNLALAHQPLGNWAEANGAIARSLDLLAGLENRPERQQVEAQVLTIAGRLHLEQGHPEQALNHWEQAAALYADLGDRPRQWQTQIYQAQAWQALGFYRRAIDGLEAVNQALQGEPDSAIKVNALQGLGDALRVVGNLARSQQVLEQGLAIAESLTLPEAVAALNLSLANTLQALGENDAALARYDQAAVGGTVRLKAQLNRLSLLVEAEAWEDARTLAAQLAEPIRVLPPGRDHIYARIKYAEALLSLRSNSPSGGTSAPHERAAEIAAGLAVAIQQAQGLGDRRAESYGLGSLGRLYGQEGQYTDAQTVTQRAFDLAQNSNADDLIYRWQWQLGQLLRSQGQRGEAIAAYRATVATLQRLRTDLVAINLEMQFTFRKTVEPIHRELVDLLTLTDASGETTPADLELARQVIESLQQAELENFFREACLDAQPVKIDEIDQQAAIFYPVILPDRLEVIVRLPDRPLQHYSKTISSQAIAEVVGQLQGQITRLLPVGPPVSPKAQELYDWLIRPIAEDLQETEVDTLVFVMDGVLRNVPMGVLHDGERYLIERYSVALSPGLQLLTPQPLEDQQLRVLAAGIAEAQAGFSALPGVENELENISQQIPSQVLLNQNFTRDRLQQAIAADPSPIVHLATHGQFSSNLEETFILIWGDRMRINQLNSLLQRTDVNRQHPIELLVMSACQTAAGDDRAVLGLAGIAVQAGARSTIASLWAVDDQATSELMVRFYQELATGNVTRAEALRRAQVAILQNPDYRERPFFWAAFVLLGNWL